MIYTCAIDMTRRTVFYVRATHTVFARVTNIFPIAPNSNTSRSGGVRFEMGKTKAHLRMDETIPGGLYLDVTLETK